MRTPPGMTRNTGRQPDATKGKRVVVLLANGRTAGEQPVTATSPLGWAADTARWSLKGEPCDIAAWRVL